MPLRTYRDLEVWRIAMDVVESIYRLAKRLPAEEKFGLASQMQRAAAAIPANIAEGYGRTHRGDYLHPISDKLVEQAGPGVEQLHRVGSGGGLGELDCAMEIIGVGQRNSRQLVLPGEIDDGLDGKRGIEERVIAVDVQRDGERFGASA